MESIMLNTLEGVESLVAAAQASDEPLVLFDDQDECLVAMRPAVFERILFDSRLINSELFPERAVGGSGDERP